jgi:ribosome-binding factor A
LDPHRHTRVSESIREEIEEMINYELADPRIGGVAVTTAHVSPDYRRAVIMLALKGTPAEQTQTLEAVKHAKEFLKHQLTDRLQLYTTPELYFEADLAPSLAAKAPKVLKRLRRGRAKDGEASPGPAEKSGGKSALS